MAKLKKSALSAFSAGDAGEKLVRDIFERAGYATRKAEEKIGHDFLVDENFRVEVKNDLMSGKTGNIAIEYRNSRKDSPSGIEATKADYWVHIVYVAGEQQVLLTRTSSLLKFTKEVKPKKTIASGGDGNADLYIYSITDIVGSLFVRIDNNANLKEIISEL